MVDGSGKAYIVAKRANHLRVRTAVATSRAARHARMNTICGLDDIRLVSNGVNGAFAAGEEVAHIAADLTGRSRPDFETGDVNEFMGLMATQMADILLHPVVSRVLTRLDAFVDV